MSDQKSIPRYSSRQRANHWFTAICFILLTLSGLAFFHPAFFFLSVFLGGGTWARILHPFIGVLMSISFFGFGLQMIGDNRITEADKQWRKQFGKILCNTAKDLPEIGKYNIGQKYLFWTLMLAVALLLITGIIIWQPYFAPSFSIGLIRLAVVVHSISAFVIMLAIIVHAYSAYWTKGSIRAMTKGTVSTAWAKHHHGAWYKQINKGGG